MVSGRGEPEPQSADHGVGVAAQCVRDHGTTLVLQQPLTEVGGLGFGNEDGDAGAGIPGGRLRDIRGDRAPQAGGWKICR